jgi:hypothetical protein
VQTKLHDGKEEDPQRNVNPGRRSGWGNHGAHDAGDSQTNHLFGDTQEKVHAGRGVPICNGQLFKDFGYMATMPALRAVLDGTYVAPEISDVATSELFAEISHIRRLVPACSVSIVITPDQWKQCWKVVNEETSLSKSGIHSGHYIVGSKSDIISHYHTAWVTVMLAHTIQLERWSHGLPVMLERTLGVTLVTKLWAILLMEGDFKSLPAKSVLAGTKLVLFGRYVLKFYVGIVQ